MSAQVVDCSQRVGGGLLFNFQGDWCNETAADSTGTQTGVTCRLSCGKIGVHPAAWAKGGNSNCNNFSKVMVLDFPAPVADVQWIVYGARKVTDNRGYSVTLNPLLFPNGKPSSAEVAFFPGRVPAAQQRSYGKAKMACLRHYSRNLKAVKDS